MRVRVTALLSAMILVPALAAGAIADTAKPQLRAVPDTKTECPSGPTDPTTGRALRPQPEPPGKVRRLRPGEMHKLNPQPEPPSSERALRPQPEPPGKKLRRPLRLGETRGMRPQPEPPGKAGTVKPTNPGALRGFNPQPEPPKPDALGGKGHPPNPC